MYSLIQNKIHPCHNEKGESSPYPEKAKKAMQNETYCFNNLFELRKLTEKKKSMFQELSYQ